MQQLEIPEATENVACPLCGGTEGIVVGQQGRFGMPVRNLCCASCATVYITPRPTAAAMAEYYRSTYRKHYGGVGYLKSDGQRVSPGEPGFEQTLGAWHDSQARNALNLSQPVTGARVLEIGCRHGKTLSIMRERCGIVPFGVEPGENEAEQARSAGIDCFTGQLESFEPGQQTFDQVQLFHVLEHVHDPLGALLKLRSLLEPNGTLLVEVPNVYRPYGPLEENFFQNVHLVSYSPNSLPALVERAGFEVKNVVDAGSLFVVAQRRELASGERLPLAFAPQLLRAPAEDASWLSQRLGTYAMLEKLLALYKQRGLSAELAAALLRTLGFPGFVAHLVDSCAYFIEELVKLGQLELALAVTLAVANGPHPPELRREFRAFAERMGAPPEALSATG
jgi:SAM-dependent methyltransferase